MFDVIFWDWRAIVEEIRRLDVLPSEVIDGLHQPFCGNGLTKEQCTVVADALEKRARCLSQEGRILLNGTRTTESDDFVFYKVRQEQNYSTNRAVIEKFIEYLRVSKGFRVC
ncbi:hypothetical protein IQ267_24540 [filamentous cyanobacterium LEGE 07170]|nr:hypothetical protein [filamentous cyanobacterium LEGE 07170]